MTASLHFDPPVIAHRGASAYAPENTLVAFTKAMQLGVKWVEFDVMLAACGEAIIFHDETLDRTTDAVGKIEKFPYSFLQTLDAGSWFDPKFASERIPTLRQTIEFLQATNMSANIELKASPGQEEALVSKIVEELAKVSNIKNTLLFSSFSLPALHFMRKYSPDSSLGVLVHEWEADWQKTCTQLNCSALDVNHKIMTEERAKEIKKMNKSLLCYTVNTPKRALELYSWGVDAVFTDVPDQIMKVLK